ncbi:MAG TPA: flippase activity-associated protein Agl23 [Blastocatellia bacterium]|nr:flippase activity-associated protein Agl23 [Blastocatellia bacterium]
MVACLPGALLYIVRMRLLGLLKRNWQWLAASSAIALIAVVVRLYDLDLKPLHQDEGVNGYFLTRLHNRGIYKYDPANFHGPTLYYAAAVSSYFFGLTTTAIRLVPALFGAGTVMLLLFLSRRVGAFGSLAAALLVAVSPGAVYISRYFIHESLFVFAGIAALVAALHYYDSGRPIYAMLGFAAFGVMCATKETFTIAIGVFVIAVALTPVYLSLRNRLGDSSRQPPNTCLNRTIERLGGGGRIALALAGSLGVFVMVAALFFSSFFTNPAWSGDVFKSLRFWTHAAATDHSHQYYTYLWWLIQEELPILVFGLAGAGLILWSARTRFAVFMVLFTLGLITAYSIIPYKTPWLTLSMIVPLAIMGGYGVNLLRERLSAPLIRGALLVLILIAVATSVYEMIVLNFVRYDDDRYPYVYAHTHRDINRLLDEVARINRDAGSADEPIAITSVEYWPLPWYFRSYSKVGYYSKVTPVREPMVVCSEDQEAELQATLGGEYQRIDSYILRPGLKLVLYAQRSSLEHRRAGF